ncbi:MAG TPA: 1-deoxy-D-xylulose-5-phosphate reductoisomerase [Acidimicrobiales bacterium]|nr:1-deoxy-D-xylulose-5-phosphate reductoisomerase [Acidimicrobiales bacterium]
MRTVSLVGSTGSIGRQAVDVILGRPDAFKVVCLAARGSARGSIELLAEQSRLLRPERVVVGDAEAAAALRGQLPAGIDVEHGPEALGGAALGAEVVLNGVVGFAGLPVTLTALRNGARLALANKESLIAAGPVVNAARRQGGGEIVPVDSEHAAVHQCLRSSLDPKLEVARLVITASGGPFRGMGAEELERVGVTDALAHPTWAMGPKITVDSSTLMNKGLEVIEAHELFDIGMDRIEVLVHPQSIVHSMVEFSDGATLAQLSMPDMRLPIAYALSYPERWPVPFGRIDWTTLSQLDFEPPDPRRFRCLALAYEAGRLGGCAPAWLSAANEVAVAAFLDGRIRWVDIAGVVESAMDAYRPRPAETVEDVLDADAGGRRSATDAVGVRAEVA